MAITTIEDAMTDMGREMVHPDLMQKARDAIAAGEVLEITILVAPGKQGASVSMHSLVASKRESHGRLIRLK